MWTCLICAFEVELDDVVVGSIVSGRCVCVRCYARETATSKAVAPWLKRQVEQAAAAPT